MKISFCNHYSLSHGGGGERVIIEAANFLAARGNEVEIHSLPLRRKNVAFTLRRDVKYCEGWVHKFNADVAYYNYQPLLTYLFLSQAPKIAGLHGANVTDYEGGSSEYLKEGPLLAGAWVIRKITGDSLLRSFNAVHTVNPDGLPIKHNMIFSIPNWIDTSRTRLDLKFEKPDKFRVLYVGKAFKIKGFETFIKVSKLFDQDDIEFVATVDCGHCGKAKCIGYIPHDQIWELYAKGGVLLYPTQRDAFGIAILESLASGTPVITTPVSGHRSLKVPLFYAYATDIIRISYLIIQIYSLWKSDYEAYLRLARQGIEAAYKYDSSVILPKFESMLYKVAEHSANMV